jgi:serine/threonine protein kinase
MLLALYEIHSKAIIHRDIKPHNIFLNDTQEIAKLGDFGVSRRIEPGQDFALTFAGTPYYVSPEILNERPYNTKADIWALGVTLYELICLQPPF